MIILGYSLSEPEIYREFYDKDIYIYWIEKYNQEALIRFSNLKNDGVNIKMIPYDGIPNDWKQGLFQVLDYLYNKAYGITLGGRL